MKRSQHGLSLVELMVGVTVALFIVSTTLFVMSNQLSDNRRLMLEIQVEQDLRAAADLVARDLRRSGYWPHAVSQLASLGAVPNHYTAVSIPNTPRAGSRISYAYSHDDADQDDSTIDSHEQTGVKLEDGVLKLQLGGNGWQALTDPNTVTVASFRVSLHSQNIELDVYCANPCPVGAKSLCPPLQQVRSVRIEISGTATHDSTVKRSLSTTARLRNDRVIGSCAT